jgi:hypothetical protein
LTIAPVCCHRTLGHVTLMGNTSGSSKALNRERQVLDVHNVESINEVEELLAVSPRVKEGLWHWDLSTKTLTYVRLPQTSPSCGLRVDKQWELDDYTSTADSYTFVVLCVGEQCSYRRVVRIRKILYGDSSSLVSQECFEDELFQLVLVLCKSCLRRQIPGGSIRSFPLQLLNTRYAAFIALLESTFQQSLVFPPPRTVHRGSIQSVAVEDAGSCFATLVKLCHSMRSPAFQVQMVVWEVSCLGDVCDKRVCLFPPLMDVEFISSTRIPFAGNSPTATH